MVFSMKIRDWSLVFIRNIIGSYISRNLFPSNVIGIDIHHKDHLLSGMDVLHSVIYKLGSRSFFIIHLVFPAAFINKFTKGRSSPFGSSINMLDDAEGNGFLLWRNHFCHVVLAIRTFARQLTFILGSNTIRFSFGGNKFPL